MRGRHVLHDGKPEPGAAGGPRAGRVDAVEALEDPFKVTFGDADPLVGHADFNAAVASARASLQQTPAYQQATAQKDHADQQVEAQQAAHEVQPTTSTASANPAGAFSEDVTKAAQQKLNAKAQLTVLQKKSINDNPAVQQARAKLDSSLAQFKAVQAKFAEVVMADKDWQAAKQKYDAANPKS